MRKHEDTVDETVVLLADKIYQYALSIKPDIGFSDEDLTYSLLLAIAKQQPDEDYSSDVLQECYAMVSELMP